MKKATLNISGMSCGHCTAAVQKALSNIDGVQVEGVQVGQATITYDPANVTDKQIADAIAEQGFAVVGA